jgi:glycosyltransferase involved in cell wall biosynthesis
MDVSVIICSHNPRSEYLRRVLDALKGQHLPKTQWELLLVDNASAPPLAVGWDLSWHPNSRHVIEHELGLASARKRGVREALADLLVFVDDDNVLATNYLAAAIRIFRSFKDLGIAGGIVEPAWFGQEPESWAVELLGNLGLRNHGNSTMVANNISHPLPPFLPVGAGMVARRVALANWIAQGDSNSLTGRRGDDLASCEDYDMALEAYGSGWSIGYFPDLKLDHLINASRLTVDYLARLNHGTSKSFIQLLHRHDMCPWNPAAPWTVPLRKARAYLRHKAWAGPLEYILWRGACGLFEGRAAIYKSAQRSRV